jgi:hypothetical protein
MDSNGLHEHEENNKSWKSVLRGARAGAKRVSDIIIEYCNRSKIVGVRDVDCGGGWRVL